MNDMSMARNPKSFFQTLKKSEASKAESGNLLLKKKKKPITKKYPKTSKHSIKHLNELSPKLMSKNSDSLIL